MIASSPEQAVAQYFDQIVEIYADNYTNGSHCSRYFDQRLKIVFSYLEKLNNARVLDVGCGPGMMADYCIDRGFDFFGIDISSRMINECINRFGHINSTHFSVGKLQKLEFPDSFFEVVLCMGALEYVSESELNKAIAEMTRVLKPGGLLIVSLLNQKALYWWNDSVLKKLKKQNDAAFSTQLFEEDSFRNRLNFHPLKDIDVSYFGSNISSSYLESIKGFSKLMAWLSLGLGNIIRGRLKWPYMAFIVKAVKKPH
jgi:ubiquinone/menaquinone biosynthesis C-methylase UbiE